MSQCDRDAAVTPTPSTGQKAGPFPRQSRRAALGALARGGSVAMTMLAFRPATAAEAAPDTSVVGEATLALTPVVNMDDLAVECRELHAEVVAAGAAQGECDETCNGYWHAHQEWLVAEIARHLPGLAPTIRMLALHIIQAAYQKPGACCTVVEGFEP